MDKYTAERVINGSHGQVWVDNDYMAEAIGIEAKLKLDTAEVKMARTLTKGYKVTGISGSGTLKLNKVTSYFLQKISGNLKAGKATRSTIITDLDDPEAFGAERISINDCIFTELTIADWELGKNLEESIPFNFSDITVIEAIEA